LLVWLDSAAAIRAELPTDALTLTNELGPESVAFRRAEADLRAVWARVVSKPSVTLKRRLWQQLPRLVYGRDVEDEALWLQHSFLVVVAKAIAARVLGFDLSERGVYGVRGYPASFNSRELRSRVCCDFCSNSIIVWLAIQHAARLLQRLRCFFRSRQRALCAVRREITEDGPREGQGVWLTAPIHHPNGYAGRLAASKILAIANLKGGVGKTTLAANIGAYLARDWNKRVLLIDLDFQGSLSSMAFPNGEWVPGPGQSSIAAKLISKDITPDLVDAVARRVPMDGGGDLKVIAAYYDLAQADNRILVEWLIECSCKTQKTLRRMLVELLNREPFKASDVRYTLAEVLHSNAVRAAFDLIIIDCPPRLTTSEIQAFCASSHLLIPTIFDWTSGEAVASLCGQIETLKRAGICPHLKYIGIAGTMQRTGKVAQQDAINLIQDALQAGNIPTGILPQRTFIPHTTQLVNDADQGIAYLAMPNWQDRQKVREAIKELAICVAGQMGLQQPLRLQAAE
jgi:chromosome partitioning protein